LVNCPGYNAKDAVKMLKNFERNPIIFEVLLTVFGFSEKIENLKKNKV
jgi:hypothetical protein